MRAKLAEMAVVCEDDAGAGEAEGVQVCVGDDHLIRVGDSANVGDEARRRDLGGEKAQIAVERRERRGPVGERLLRVEGGWIPRLHAEAGQVEKGVHHARAIRLRHETVVGVKQQVPHRERLTEICEDAADASMVRLAWIDVGVRRTG
jgi:hypothetical protein